MPPEQPCGTMTPMRVADEAQFWEAIDFAGSFFMEKSSVHLAMANLARLLEAEGIPYAIVGAMALNAWGYRRVTVDVDVLLTREGLERFRRRALGRGYVEKFPGSKGVRDTAQGVTIDVLLAGDYPGDGLPKPVRFPDPSEAERVGEVRILSLRRIVELKLASGISAPHRLKDLADVLELIRAAKLPRELAGSLDETVRAKYRELWDAAQQPDLVGEG